MNTVNTVNTESTTSTMNVLSNLSKERIWYLADVIENLELNPNTKKSKLTQMQLKQRLVTQNYTIDFPPYFWMGEFDFYPEGISAGIIDCQTPACMMGWANALWPVKDDEDKGKYRCKSEAASESLGISKTTVTELAYPEYEADVPMSTITPKQAAEVLRHFAQTGKVDWDRVLGKKEEEVEEIES